MVVAAGASALEGWTVEFDADFEITNIWNAVIKSHVGTHYVIVNASYNANLAAGAETGFGFQASATTTAISGLELNGEADVDLPALTVSDARVLEGSSGTVEMVFTVTLSEASDSNVSLHYRCLLYTSRCV